MEIVKQYLEKRIEQLKADLATVPKPKANSNYTLKQELFIERILKRQTIQELEQILTLFNEEYETVKSKIENNNERMRDVLTSLDKLNSELFPKQC